MIAQIVIQLILQTFCFLLLISRQFQMKYMTESQHL